MTGKIYKKYLFIALLGFLNLFGCKQSTKDRVFTVFNEGVSLSLDALNLDQNGKHEAASALNKEAIEKFKETLRIDSLHHGARGALGHNYYLTGEFQNAIDWLEKAHAHNEKTAATFRELGLSRINLDQIEAGQKDIETAFQLDKSQEIKNITADDLYDIGKLAFEYSSEYTKQGQIEQGKTYQVFSLEVLQLALTIDNSRRDIATTLVEFADKAGDKAFANKYR